MFLLKLRLSVYFWLFFIVYFTVLLVLPSIKFDSGALTLFSVNSFLYGFYIAPILSGQKARVEELHKIIRSEANALFSMTLISKKYSKEVHEKVVDMIRQYIGAILKEKNAGAGENEYERMITYAVSYKGKDDKSAEDFLKQLIANQSNRSNLVMQLRNKVYSNEWSVMLVLFSITLSFVVLLDIGNSIVLMVVKSLLCSGLSMLLLILVKLSTLRHKKAQMMWEPMQKLLGTNFYRID